LKAAKNWRWANEEAWRKIFVHQDLTLKEREERNTLLLEKKVREQNGEKDLILVGNKIVKRYRRKPNPDQELISVAAEAAAAAANHETTA